MQTCYQPVGVCFVFFVLSSIVVPCMIPWTGVAFIVVSAITSYDIHMYLNAISRSRGISYDWTLFRNGFGGRETAHDK